MDKEMEIKDLLGLEQPLTKLIECVSAGIGKVYEPMHIKRMARAKKEEIKVIGEVLSDNISLPSKYDDGKVMIDTTEVEELIKRTGNRVLYKELRKQQNIETVIAETYEILEKEEEVSKESVNQDWLYNFFDYAEDVSDEYMQKIWANILAGEIKCPNTYTFRTLTTLKNITRNEAILFSELMRFLIFYVDEPVIYNSNELLKKYEIYYNKLMNIEDCGLINLNDSVLLNIENGALFNTNIICMVDGKLKVPAYSLTESGKQIANLMRDSIDFNNDYFLDFCKDIKKQKPSVVFKAFKITSIVGDDILYDNSKDLLENL